MEWKMGKETNKKKLFPGKKELEVVQYIFAILFIWQKKQEKV